MPLTPQHRPLHHLPLGVMVLLVGWSVLLVSTNISVHALILRPVAVDRGLMSYSSSSNRRRRRKSLTVGPRFASPPTPSDQQEQTEPPVNGNSTTTSSTTTTTTFSTEDCIPCQTAAYDANKSCDLGEQLREDIEDGYARRMESNINNNNNNNNETSTLANVTESILNSTFVRFDTVHLRRFLLDRRSYGRWLPFTKLNLKTPPVVEDLLPEPTRIADSFYLSVPAAVLSFVAASLSFPILMNNLVRTMETPPEYLDQVISKLAPGISILYGTFISLTLSILYNRQRNVQDSVAQETSLLSFLLHNLVSLFRQDRNRMVRAGQSTADQVRILLRESRGVEYMTIIYTDPYIRMMTLVEEEEERLVKEHGDFLSKGPVLGTCRDTLRDLRKIRASRLSDESLALPPTHFVILQALTFLLLMGYLVSVLPAVDELGYTPMESTVLFGILSTVYLLFYGIAKDLNDLYNGVFQVRRGSSACHLLEIKKTVADHPWLAFEVDFETVNREIRCFYPELADLWMEGEQQRF